MVQLWTTDCIPFCTIPILYRMLTTIEFIIPIKKVDLPITERPYVFSLVYCFHIFTLLVESCLPHLLE